MPKKPASEKQIESFSHDDASRRNIPPAEYQTMVQNQEKTPLQVAYERRNPDLDPQLIWRGKDLLDESPQVVNAPPLYIQEKIHPKVLIDDLKRRSKQGEGESAQIDLFSAFNGLPSEEAKTEFYQHDQNWSNRMILGDSLQVMASLAEREGLRGKVQCIYFDPPYGIKFNSNFQWSTTSRDVNDGKADHITREPEQVKAFRDTWRDGIHSYLTYLRDRLTVARDLLTDSGSIFVQIGDENVHRVRSVMDEVFGEDNFISLISVKKSSAQTSNLLTGSNDYLCWFAKNTTRVKYRQLFVDKGFDTDAGSEYRYALGEHRERLQIPSEYLAGEKELPQGWRPYRPSPLTSQGFRTNTTVPFTFEGKEFHPGLGANWKTTLAGLKRLVACDRILARDKSLSYLRLIGDYPVYTINNVWEDTKWGFDARDKTYVVQTNTKVLQRCLLMATDPGDLVLDPTCGSGTTATVAEQWGRRWITIDTSRVALALARARIMGARYPFYLLADSRDGQRKEAEVTRTAPSSQPVQGNIRQGFVYERVPHITLKSIANNVEIDVIWEKWQAKLEPFRQELNTSLGKTWQEWEIPREVEAQWPDAAKTLHTEWWQARIALQKEIDKSIAAKAEFEFLYDKPYGDNKKVRVAGPFTVESLSPHRTMIVNHDDSLVDPHKQGATSEGATDFAQMILDTLRVAGVQQAHKEDRISFESLEGWPGSYIAGKGAYRDSDDTLETAGIFIGPEFGTVSRVDLVEAARECADAGFNVLISCAFNYEAQSTEFNNLGPLPVLKARMNADLHMQPDLKNTGKGNLFVIFGEPDIDILDAPEDKIQVKINGVDVFDPSTGEVRSDEPATIACWFIDSDYNGESFFVRQAYFLGQNDPYKSLKTSLKAEIDADAWDSLNSDTSVPFAKPSTGRIAVKVINHLGDEVMKVYRVA
ncbi:site-specific DNA-methyltransferase [Cyanobium sp. WKJ7-Wakatipu]|uniref:site-specific DNA-methyltransferase n=1 Tax=Cyanobium sp. WKJ7-Wakatipu TaxID=2823726 RepID=UPI0020CB8B51|nr:site-specific DNA-methyltransferase [Cyanobium sp. WKJ7-Wakatipu]MCP9784177.1 site-specific DNA-methyltransferase [Cyanobium sp. WKJ7-Wakatipu]